MHDYIYFGRNTSGTFTANQIFFHVASFLHMSQWRVPVPELEISDSKPYRIFKLPLILSMIVNSGGNKLFLLSKSISSKGSRA